MPSFTIPLKIRIRESAQTAKFRLVLEDLVNRPDVLAILLRQAMAETLLVEYRKRFDKNYSAMHTTELYPPIHETPTPDNNKETLFERIHKLEANKARLQLQATKNPQHADVIAIGIRDLQAEIDQVTKRYFLEIAREEGGGGGGGVEGRGDLEGLRITGGQLATTHLFRPMMNKIRDLLTANTNIAQAPVGSGNISFGIGKIDTLESSKFQTPSATPSGSTSKFNVMWKQLEFGTGIYAKRGPYFRTEGVYKDDYGEGGWWYGGAVGPDARRRRIHVKGTRGGHFLRDASGIPYKGDAAKFQSYFALLLSRELFGARR